MIVFAYLLGAVPFGFLIAIYHGKDLRKIGSGNIGATNVLRTGNRGLAALTLLLDGGKGLLTAAAAGHIFGPDFAVLAGGGAVLGHIFPAWLRFKGGKGVATGIGVLLAVSWLAGLLVVATWLVVAAVFRYSSLAALVALALAPVYMWWLADMQMMELALFVSILIWIRHIGNLVRLFRGEEPKIGVVSRSSNGR